MGSKEKCALKNEDYDLLAPDGGWGYVVCGSAVVLFIMTTGFNPSFGLIYKDLIDEINLGSTEISTLNGLTGLCFAFTGFATSSLLRYFTKRQLGVAVVALFNCGCLIAVFARSAIALYLVFLLQGISFGMLYNLIFALINEYFDKKKLFANSIVQAIHAGSMIGIPQFVNFLHDAYGYRGTLLMIMGVSLQGFVAVALMQPVEWHMRKVPKLPVKGEHQVLMMDEDNVPTIQLNHLEPEITFDHDDKKTCSTTKMLKDMFDVPIIKQMLTSNMTWGMSITLFTDVIVTTFLPQSLYSDKWDNNSVALAVTLYTVGDLAGRIFLTIFSKWIKLGSQEMYLIGLLLTVISRVGFSCSTSVAMTLVSVTSIGFSRCFLVIFCPLMVADAVSVEKFSAAMGFNMAVMGVTALCLSPAAGAIRDYTDSYAVLFWTLNGMTAACLVSWTIEIVYKRLKSSHKKAKR